MNTTHTPTTTTGRLSELGSPRRWRYVLTGLGVFAATIVLFYAEENWRGRRVWENCRQELEAKGARLDWAYYVPPPVPEDQNAFGVPEMVQWFVKKSPPQKVLGLGVVVTGSVGRNTTELPKMLSYRGSTNSACAVVARLTIGLPGSSPPAGATVLSWPDGKGAQAEAARSIMAALGPTAEDPAGLDHFMLKRPEEVQPAKLFLQCEKTPTEKDLGQWLKLVENQGEVRLESKGANDYQVRTVASISAADYVAWGETIEPELAIIRQAARRPYARMPGNYQNPMEVPIPNFVSIRTVAQRLAALARCHLLLNQPEKALEDLTLMHQLCRLLEARPTGRPITLVAAMINVAVKGLYVETFKEGMRMHVWREPQLVALQEQLKETDLRVQVAGGLSTEQASLIRVVEITPKSELGILFKLAEVVSSGNRSSPPGLKIVFSLIPQGWVDQNLAVYANMEEIIRESLDPKRQDIEPRKLDAVEPAIEAAVEHPSPFNLLARIAIPNVSKAGHTLAHNQVLVIEGQIACALERYRLARGEYPPTLEALTPQFMTKVPHDLIGGQPFHYRRTNDGRFILYSVGWNEKDDGGIVSLTKSGTVDWDNGDWVWQYADFPKP